MAAKVMSGYRERHLAGRQYAPAPLVLAYSINRSSAAISLNGGALISPVPQQLPTPRRNASTNVRIHKAMSTSGGSSADAAIVPPTPMSARRYSMPTQHEQQYFETLCRQRFYESSSTAAADIERILRTAATSATAQSCYNRILSSVRSKYHDDMARERQAALSVTLEQAGPDAFMTRDERRKSFKQFFDAHVSKEMIGSHPFAKGLYSLLLLQSARSSKGGAGEYCIDWTLDEEVFIEAGPGAWTRDSIAILKTALRMVNVSATVLATTASTSSAPNEAVVPHRGALTASLRMSTDARRSIDREHQLTTDQANDPHEEQQLSQPPISAKLSTFGDINRGNLTTQAGVLAEGQQHTFRFTRDMGNADIVDLLSVFPTWISTPSVRSLTFIASSTDARKMQEPSLADLEDGMQIPPGGEHPTNKLKVGTGFLTISRETRLAGYEATLVERVKDWLKRILGLQS